MEKLNAMDREGMCPKLKKYYEKDATKKLKYVQAIHTKEFLKSLPNEIAEVLEESFLLGNCLKNVDGGNTVIEYLLLHSDILPELKKFPGTYTMLEKMYGFEDVHFPVDLFFSKSIPALPTLSSRYHVVNEQSIKIIEEILEKQETCLMIDIGSGPGRNSIDICKIMPNFVNKVLIENIDIDEQAISKGELLVKEAGFCNIKFVSKSMTKLNGYYKGNVDFGLLIGILCGLPFDERVSLLKRVKPYFKKGAKLIAAGLLNKMLELDLFCSYLLKEVSDWVLQHPPLGDVEKAFLEAGYEYEGYVQDKYECYEIGIGIVK